MDYASGKYFGVRGAVQAVLEPLRVGATLAALTETATLRFGVDRDVVERDLRGILCQLVEKGLVLEGEAA